MTSPTICLCSLAEAPSGVINTVISMGLKVRPCVCSTQRALQGSRSRQAFRYKDSSLLLEPKTELPS
jgi:hypothetical protein